MSNSIGKNLQISIFGQSHSEAIGVVIDGFPAGFAVDMPALEAFLARRSSVGKAFATKRTEPDKPEFLSGLINCVTCGAPLSAIIRNTNVRSSDYQATENIPRPSHADFTAEVKYGGFQDKAGGGHFSGRLTAPLCLAGGLCLQWLSKKGIHIFSHIAAIKNVYDRPFSPMHPENTIKDIHFPVLDVVQGEKMLSVIEQARQNGDSVGGLVECAAVGVPPGLGDPMFDGLENRLAAMLFGIPGVKGVEFGDGFSSATLYGSENNDAFYMDGDTVRTKTNHHGGILGGISSGMPILLRVAFKPTPSIAKVQQSVDLLQKKDVPLTIHGRHDPCIVPRAAACVEAAVAIALFDFIFH